MNGEEFAEFIRTHFKSAFERSANPKGELFLQDGDPSQNNRKVQNAMYAVDARKFSIPPHSPDANPIKMYSAKLSDSCVKRPYTKR